MLSNSCHGNQPYKRFSVTLWLSETLKGISNALQNLRFVQLRVDEIVCVCVCVGGGGGGEITPLV